MVIEVSHLLFADNILIFSGANVDQLVQLRWVLLCFELVSGLKVDL